MKNAAFCSVLVLGLMGCGVGSPDCTATIMMIVSPAAATADHAASAPGNQAKFTAAGSPTAPPGCPLPTYVVLLHPTWTNPDAKDIQISSANDATNGAATCLGATSGAVTLTANATFGSSALQGTATLTCQ